MAYEAQRECWLPVLSTCRSAGTCEKGAEVGAVIHGLMYILLLRPLSAVKAVRGRF
jgi:hypothetical protein